MKATKKALISSVLALFLCFTMLVGTTYAWFTDSVTSAGNIITAGTLDVTMEWAEGNLAPSTATWTDASEGAMFDNDLWEPGYVEAKHIKITNVGSLALNYKLRIVANGIVSDLANVIDVYYFDTATQLTRDTAATDGKRLGTLAQVLGSGAFNEKEYPDAPYYANPLYKNVFGQLVAKGNETATLNSQRTLTLALKMQESAGNEYQGLAIGTDFSIELIATQMMSENDSFGPEYDKVVPDPSIPKAFVKPLDSLYFDTEDSKIGYDLVDMYGINTLDVGYQFEPTVDIDDVELSEYKNWHADFYVYTDKDVAPEAIALAGWYEAWCKLNAGKWVALAINETIHAATSEKGGIRLVKDGVSKAFGGDNINVSWKEIVEFGNDGKGFQCGAVALKDSAAGTTLTVELRIYETLPPEQTNNNSTNVETGKYITVGKFTYTFPKNVDSQQGLAESLASGGTITLAAGEYQMPSNDNSTANLTIVGTKDTVVDLTNGAYMDKANVTFKGVTIKTGTGKVNGNGSDYAALYTPDATYIDCTFVGPMRVGRDGAKFINCTFTELGNDYVWTYGNDVTFEGCTFNTDGKAILIYNDGGKEVADVTVKNCVFNSTMGNKAGAIANQNCAAIEIDNYGNGVNLVTEGNTYDAKFSGEWRIKSYDSAKTDVIVNGVEYNSIAIDGKLMTIDANKNVTVK